MSERDPSGSLRFLVVAPFFPKDTTDPLVGGWINNPASLWSRMASTGHDVTILTYGRPRAQWKFGDAKVISVGPIWLKGIFFNLVLEWRLGFYAVRLGLGGRWDQIRIHHFGGLWALVLKAVGWLSGSIVVTAHGTTVSENIANELATGRRLLRDAPKRASRKVQYWLDRFLYRRADFVVSPSEFQTRELRDLYGVPEGKIRVIPHGYDDMRFIRSRETEEAGKVFIGAAPGTKIILMVARAAPKKGFYFFLQAAKIFFDRYSTKSPLFVAVIGSPLHRPAEISVETLFMEASPNLKVFQNVAEDMLPNLYAASTVCVIPSIGYESVPSVLYEAVACGCTIVATRLPGMEEVVDGYFLDELRPEGIASALEMVLEKQMKSSFLRDFRLTALLPQHAHIAR